MAIYDPYLDDEEEPRGLSDRPTVSDLRRVSHAMLESYAISDVDVDPVREILFTNEVARSFWGKTWCANLDDWGASRHKLARGRTYVRCGAVVNLRIYEGTAFVRVCGTGLYTVLVRVGPIDPERWASIQARCAGRIESLAALVQPDPPAPVREIVAHPETGLFPARAELTAHCDCFIGRGICVHATAALYGIGARLDRSPEELFWLRGIDPDRLTERAVAEAVSAPDRGGPPPADLSAIFGVAVEDTDPGD
ncbi:MAG: hypothetical protein OXE58_15795 [Acidobacteria bacterium]|nr:hypothetical protein [Acidobacteriota bacterium]